MWSAILPKATIKHFIAVLVLLTLLPATLGGADNPSVRRILIINEAGTAWPGINLIDQGIRAALETAPYELEFYREYMDTILFPDPADQQRFREFYIRKYRDRRPDVIITVGPTPLKFMAETQSTAFPGVPIVFSYPNWAPGSPVLDSGFTGVENDLAAFDTIETALRLRPGTKHIIVVGGTSFNDTQFLGVAKAQLKPFESSFDVTYLTKLTMPDLLVRLKNLPKQSIVLITSLTRDAAGSSFTAARASAMVAQAASAPVFTLVDANFGHGEVGGKVSSLPEQGRIAGELALRILKGEKPQDVARVKTGTIYTFDWRALKRWDISESGLPPASIITNRQVTFWQTYKWYVISGASLIACQALLIVGLLWQRAKRRQRENELVIAYERLRLAVEAGRFVGWDTDFRTGRNSWFGDLQGMFGIPSDTHSIEIGDFASYIHADDVDAVKRAIDDARENHRPYVTEFRTRRDDGNSGWIVARGRFWYGSNGNPVRMLGMAIDITERKQAEEALSTVSRRLIEAHEEERTRIARELHDDINQRLAFLAVKLSSLEKEVPASDASTKMFVDEFRQEVTDLGNDVQALSHRLHSSKLEYLGLAAAASGFCKEFSHRHNVEVGFEHDNIPRNLSPEISLCLFRVLQEALQNAMKYSGVRRFEVALDYKSNEVHLTVRDSGVGFDPESAMNRHGLGLISMMERLKLVAGQLSIDSKPRCGTTIRACVPFKAKVQSEVQAGIATS